MSAVSAHHKHKNYLIASSTQLPCLALSFAIQSQKATVQRSMSAQRKNLKIAQILNTQNMHLSADFRSTMNCRELMIAVNLDNIIAILVLGKNTSRAQNFLHNATLFLLICAMLQYSLVDHKRSTSYLNIWQILK
jgi:hypothetical protein